MSKTYQSGPKSNIDTKNDALENVSPASNVAILGIYVTFQGCSYKVGSEITPHLWD